MKFRKRPVVVDAIPVQTLMVGALEFFPEWVLQARRDNVIWPTATEGHGYLVKTLEGVMLAKVDDWLIRGVKGEIYPCKPDIFEATYEPCATDAISEEKKP